MVHYSKMVPAQEEVTANDGCETAKPFLSFGIDRILFGHFKTEQERLKKKHSSGIGSNRISLPNFNWLGYTRYNPPKLPSKYNDAFIL